MHRSMFRLAFLWLVVISCFSLSELIAEAPLDTLFQKPASIAYSLDEIVVSAQRAPVFRHELLRVVQLIGQADIAQSPAHDLSGILQHQRGVDVRRRGAPGMQADVGIRGGTFDQTMILVNGINLSDPQTGHHLLNLPVSLQAIERIEILNGPGARIFGPNAFSGAINVITKLPDEPILQSAFHMGQYGYGNLALTAGLRHGGQGNALFRHLIAGGGMISDGYTQNTDYRSGDIYYRGIIEHRGFVIDAQGGYMNKAFGANSFYSPRFPNQFEEIHSRFASVKILPVSLPGTFFSAYWRRHNDRFELFRDDAPDWYAGHNHHQTDVFGLSANFRLDSRIGVSSFGLDYRNEHIFSNVLGVRMTEPIAIRGYDAVYSHSYARSGLGIMAEHSLNIGSLLLSGGVLTYIHQDLEDGIQFFPGLDAGYRLSDAWHIYSSVNQTLRLPTFTDLFYSGPTNLGNAELLPERALSAESGIRMHGSLFSFDASLFRRWGKQMIDWVRYPGSEQWLSMNHTSVNISGFEVGGSWNPLNAGNGLQGATSFSGPSFKWAYALTHVDKVSGDMVSNYALDHLRHKADIGIAWNFNARLNVSTMASWRDRAGAYLKYEGNMFTDMVDFAPYWVIDMRVTYRMKRIEIYTDATNLLNTHIVDIANVPLPGRWVVIGVSGRILP